MPWMTRIVKSKLEDLESAGWVCTWKGEKFLGSRTWTWTWLIGEGYLSRTSGNKRANSPEAIRLSMAKWLHFCRDQIFYPTKDSIGAGSTGETIDNEGEDDTEKMEDETQEGQDNPSLYVSTTMFN